MTCKYRSHMKSKSPYSNAEYWTCYCPESPHMGAILWKGCPEHCVHYEEEKRCSECGTRLTAHERKHYGNLCAECQLERIAIEKEDDA